MRRVASPLVLAAAAAALTLAGCGSSPSTATSPTSSASATTATPAASGQAGDVMFAQRMIPHHRQAVEMADIALAKSSASADVKALATKIKAAQDPEITTMTSWLTAWGASVPIGAAATGMGQSGMDHGTGAGMMGTGAGMMGEADFATLKAANGADFDKKWLTMMIAHHEGAVTMAEHVLTTTSNPDVKTLAQQIITAQKAEITEMQQRL